MANSSASRSFGEIDEERRGGRERERVRVSTFDGARKGVEKADSKRIAPLDFSTIKTSFEFRPFKYTGSTLGG